MPDPATSAELAREQEHLDKAERDLAAGEDRIAQQVELIERLRESGQSVSEAEGLLDTLQQTLQVWRDHREEILRRIAYLRGDVGSTMPGSH